jgi:hypothetical protein
VGNEGAVVVQGIASILFHCNLNGNQLSSRSNLLIFLLPIPCCSFPDVAPLTLGDTPAIHKPLLEKMNRIGHTVTHEVITGGVGYNQLKSLDQMLQTAPSADQISMDGIYTNGPAIAWHCAAALGPATLLLFGKNGNYVPWPALLMEGTRQQPLIPPLSSDSPFPRILTSCSSWNETEQRLWLLGGLTPDGVDHDLWSLTLIGNDPWNPEMWMWKYHVIPTLQFLIAPSLMSWQQGLLVCFGANLEWKPSSSCSFIGNLTGTPNVLWNSTSNVVSRFGTSIFTHENQTYALGGWADNSTLLNDVLQWNGNVWTPSSINEIEFLGAAMTTVKVLGTMEVDLVGGTNSSNLISAYILNPEPSMSSSLILAIVALCVLMTSLGVMIYFAWKYWAKEDVRLVPILTRFQPRPVSPVAANNPLPDLPKQLGTGEPLLFTPWKCNNDVLVSQTLARINLDAVNNASKTYDRIKPDYSKEMVQLPDGNFGYDTGFNKSIELQNGASVSFGAGFGYGVGFGSSGKKDSWGMGGGGGGGGGLEYNDGNGWRLGFGAGTGGGGGLGWNDKGFGG